MRDPVNSDLCNELSDFVMPLVAYLPVWLPSYHGISRNCSRSPKYTRDFIFVARARGASIGIVNPDQNGFAEPRQASKSIKNKKIGR